MIYIKQHNETYIKLEISDFGIEQEVADFFTFFAEGYKFTPKYRAGIWDGKIRLFNSRNKQLPKGLIPVLTKFCDDRSYEYELPTELNLATGYTREEIVAFADALNLSTKGKPIKLRDYQLEAVVQGLTEYRKILLAATSAGKSSMLYAMIRWHLEHDRNILLVVPTTQLVEQMFSDFADYSQLNGWDAEEHCQMLYSGKEKIFAKRVMISTWQSLAAMAKNNPTLFRSITDRTDVAYFDEGHTYKASVVLDIMSRFDRTAWRCGTTGTLDNSKLNQLNLIGLMGMPVKIVSTKELIDAKNVTQLLIKLFILDYPDDVKSKLKKIKYKDEIAFITTCKERNEFISRLAVSCTGNTLILFDYVEKHGAILNEMIKALAPERYVKFLHGGVSVDDREQVRKDLETEDSAILIANSRLFSTGTNIPSLENIIFAMPSKSTIKVRQSIGRGLRLKAGKTRCQLFDIADDISYKGTPNTTLLHMYERVKIYDQEEFEYQVKKLPLKVSL